MKKQPAYILVLALIVMSIILVLTTTSLDVVSYDNSFDFLAYHQTQALYIAEAGVDYAIRQLNSNSDYPGESNLALGAGTVNIQPEY